MTVRLGFVVPNKIVIERLDIWHGSHRIQVGPDGKIALDGNAMEMEECSCTLFEGWGSALNIVDHPDSGLGYGFGAMGPPVALAGGLLTRDGTAAP